MGYNDECSKECNSYYSIEKIADKYCTRSYMGKEEYVKCDGCGEFLRDGDIYYPDIGVCEYCLQNYRSVVKI